MTGVGRTLPIGLFVIFSALCALIGFEVTDAAPARQPDLATPVVAPSRLSSAAVAVPPDGHSSWFREILARPLFSPDRKPIVAAARSTAGLPRLTGIVITDARRIAIFAAASGAHPTVVEAGSHFGVYHVLEIVDGGVTVEGPEGTTVIKPVFDASPVNVAKTPLLPRPELSKPTPR